MRIRHRRLRRIHSMDIHRLRRHGVPDRGFTTFRHRRLRRVITEAAGKAESRQTETDPPGFFCFK